MVRLRLLKLPLKSNLGFGFYTVNDLGDLPYSNLWVHIEYFTGNLTTQPTGMSLEKNPERLSSAQATHDLASMAPDAAAFTPHRPIRLGGLVSQLKVSDHNVLDTDGNLMLRNLAWMFR